MYPTIAANANFGRGIYFADEAARIDQYARVDKRFEKEGQLAELHEKIYGSNKHPRNVRYCLISRVLFGNYVVTKDGETRLGDDGKWVLVQCFKQSEKRIGAAR